jgi:hypothetical protein
VIVHVRGEEGAGLRHVAFEQGIAEAGHERRGIGRHGLSSFGYLVTPTGIRRAAGSSSTTGGSLSTGTAARLKTTAGARIYRVERRPLVDSKRTQGIRFGIRFSGRRKSFRLTADVVLAGVMP